MVSVGHSKDKGGTSKTGYHNIFKDNAKALAAIFGDVLSKGTSGLTTPMGILGSIDNALFSSDPNQDFLGAKARLTDLLSGKALSSGYNQAFEALLPNARRSIDLLNQDVLSSSSPLGLRFSSDVLNQQRTGANDILLGTQGQALQTALQQMGLQLQGATSIYDRQAQLREGQLARQIPLLAQLLASQGKSTSSGGTNSSLSIFGGGGSSSGK